MSALEAVFLFATSGPVFYYYYARSNVTLDKWMYKSNPKYPSPEKVLIRFFALYFYFQLLQVFMLLTVFTETRPQLPLLNKD